MYNFVIEQIKDDTIDKKKEYEFRITVYNNNITTISHYNNSYKNTIECENIRKFYDMIHNKFKALRLLDSYTLDFDSNFILIDIHEDEKGLFTEKAQLCNTHNTIYYRIINC